MDLKKHDYVTRVAHGDYPPGTPCKAWRDELGELQLEFSGDVVLNLGTKYYLEGIEEPPRGSLIDQSIREIQAIEDERAMEMLHQAEIGY